MNPQEEQHLRRMIVEEIENTLKRMLSIIVAPEQATTPPTVICADTGNPLLMNDAELRYAEKLVPADERPILRLRVMAARLDARGQKKAGDQQRSRAASMERNLSLRQSRA
jgi:hypothetical protein